MNNTMTDDTDTAVRPKRVRPPRTKNTDHFPDAGKLIPPPPLHIPDAKAHEWMDWIFTYLPNEMARNFYGGINYTPRS